jgi:hypothetical protein
VAIHLKSLALCSLLAASLQASAATTALPVTWKDLTSPDMSGKAQDAPLSENLKGQEVTIEGYLLPVDREEDLVYEFLLVPWVGACSHMPQPPVNQMVLVTPSTPYKLAEAYEPVTVTGTLKTGVERTQFYMLDGVIQLDVGYGMSRADVVHTENAVAPISRDSNPWKAITK